MKQREQVWKELEVKLGQMEIRLPSGAWENKEDLVKTVNGETFGISQEGDAAPAFCRALDYCREHHIQKLVIPKGVYHFRSCFGPAHLALDDMEDFVFDGQGSEFIFETVRSYLSIKRSRQILVKNVVLDWNWDKAPLASVGVVTQVAEDGSFLTCTFPEYQKVSADMKFSIVGPFDPARYTPGCRGGIEFRPYRNDHVKASGDERSDEKMQELVRELSNIFLP